MADRNYYMRVYVYVCGHVSFSREMDAIVVVHFPLRVLLITIICSSRLPFEIGNFRVFFYRKENWITFLALISFFFNGRISLSIALDVCFENVCVCVNCSENINHKSRETYSMFWGISVWVCVCVVIVLISWAVFLSIRINNLCFF